MRTDKQRVGEIEAEVNNNIKDIQEYSSKIQDVLQSNLKHSLSAKGQDELKKTLNELDSQLFVLGKLRNKIVDIKK